MRDTPLVLVVDDTPANVDILRARLESHAYEVATAADGAEALDRISALEPDLVLLDVMMPKVDGFEVCRRVRADKSLPFLPIVMLTAKSDHRDVATGLDAGADDYLGKPFDQAELMARVRSMLRIKTLHDQVRAQAHQLAELNAGLEQRVAAQVAEIEGMLREAEAARRTARELEIARDVQQRLLAAASLHQVDGLEFAATCRPARQVGGDYFDLIPLPDTLVAIVVGDVSGKGIGAALMMASVQATLRALVLQHTDSCATLVSRLNAKLVAASTGLYSTLFFGLYDCRKRSLTVVNAGHCYPLLMSGGTVKELSSQGPPVGLLPDVTYDEQVFTFAPGDSLICYSDGLSEAHNVGGELWEDHGFRDLVSRVGGLAGQEVLDRVMSAADRFSAGANQHDDMTLVSVRVTG